MSVYEDWQLRIKQHAEGRDLADVESEAEAVGLAIRVMREDGKNCIGTCDYRPERINVEVENGKIKSVLSFG